MTGMIMENAVVAVTTVRIMEPEVIQEAEEITEEVAVDRDNNNGAAEEITEAVATTTETITVILKKGINSYTNTNELH